MNATMVSEEIAGLRISASYCPTRESMRRLPQALQPFLTWLTGKPLSGAVWPRRTPLSYCLKAVGLLLCGIVLSACGGPWGLLPGWILTISGARTLQLLILHQCAHDTFSTNSRHNERLGSVIAVALLIENFQQYRQAHLHHHHSNLHMSSEDPTIQFLFEKVGLQPGMPKRMIWRKVILTLLSPKFHLHTVCERLHSQLIAPHPYRLVAWILWTTLIVNLIVMHQVGSFLLVWAIPFGPLYNISSCLRLCSEHRWSPRSATPREHITDHSTGIFLGSPAPAAGRWSAQHMWAWCAWLGLMFGYHFPARLLVLVGDTPCHDYHHRQPRSQHWTHYAYARQRDVEIHRGWPHYTEIWGFFQAIDAAFATLSQHHGGAHVE